MQIYDKKRGNLSKGMYKKNVRRKEIELIKRLCSLFSNALFIREQNGEELHFLILIIFTEKYFLHGNHIWPTLFVKSGLRFKLK